MTDNIKKVKMKRSVLIIVAIILMAIITTGFTFLFVYYLKKDYEKDGQRQYQILYNKYVNIKNNDGLSGLKQLNEDFIAWFVCEDLGITLPVVKANSPIDEEFYLNHSLEKEESIFGTPYQRFGCDIFNSDNSVIVGHSSFSGGPIVFSEFIRYLPENIGTNNFTFKIKLETENGILTYEVISVFDFSLYFDYSDQFEIYNTNNFISEEKFIDFYTKIKELSKIDFGISAEYGDKFITIMTCSEQTTSERIMVVAKLIN